MKKWIVMLLVAILLFGSVIGFNLQTKKDRRVHGQYARA